MTEIWQGLKEHTYRRGYMRRPFPEPHPNPSCLWCTWLWDGRDDGPILKARMTAGEAETYRNRLPAFVRQMEHRS